MGRVSEGGVESVVEGLGDEERALGVGMHGLELGTGMAGGF